MSCKHAGATQAQNMPKCRSANRILKVHRESNREIRSIYLSPTMHYKDWCEKCCAPGRNALAHPLCITTARREKGLHINFALALGNTVESSVNSDLLPKSGPSLTCVSTCISRISSPRSLDKRASVNAGTHLLTYY